MTAQQQPQAAAARKDGRTDEQMVQDKAEEREAAQEQMRELEEGDAPTNLEGWPSGPAQYLTYGSEDDQYGTGVTAKLGPPDLRHYADGSVSIGGEMVDNPEDYKGEAIVGAVTKHNNPG